MSRHVRRLWGCDSEPCGYCGKVSYPTERSATRALRTLNRGRRTGMGVYRCRSGGVSFHFGHRPRNHQWPDWDDARCDEQCHRCPVVIVAGQPVALLGTLRLCFGCGDRAEQAALSKVAS